MQRGSNVGGTLQMALPKVMGDSAMGNHTVESPMTFGSDLRITNACIIATNSSIYAFISVSNNLRILTSAVAREFIFFFSL